MKAMFWYNPGCILLNSTPFLTYFLFFKKESGQRKTIIQMPGRLSKKALPFLIVLALSIPFLSPHQFFDITDSMDMFNISVSVYELGDLSSAVKTKLATGETTMVYSKYGLGLPFLMVPFNFRPELGAVVAFRAEVFMDGIENHRDAALTASAL